MSNKLSVVRKGFFFRIHGVLHCAVIHLFASFADAIAVPAPANITPPSPAFGNAALVSFRSFWQNPGMNPDSHEQFPVSLDDATKAKVDEAVAATGLTVAEVLRLAIESGLRVMETTRQN